LDKLTILTITAFETAHSNGSLFLQLPSVSQDTLSTINELTEFLKAVNQAVRYFGNKQYIESVKKWDQALAQLQVDAKLKDEAKKQKAATIDTAVSETIGESASLAAQNEYENSIKLLTELSSLPLSNAQKARVFSTKKEIVEKGQLYILNVARSLKKEGKDMEALRTKTRAETIGLNNELQEFYTDLKKNFDYAQITNLQDAGYFINCPGGYTTNLTFPMQSNSGQFCEAQIDLSQQLELGMYIGYVRGNSEQEVKLHLLNRKWAEAILGNKTIDAVFRIEGISKVKRALTGVESFLPLLGINYLQVIP